MWSGDAKFDPNNAGTKALAERTTRQVIGASGLSVTAQQAAVVKSLVIQAAYGYARNVYEQRGQGLSNQDFNKSLDTIGQSGSPEQMTAVLKQLMDDAHQNYVAKRTAKTGKGEIPLHEWDDQKLIGFGTQSDTVPPGLQREIIKELQYRIESRKKAGGRSVPPGMSKLGGPTDAAADPEQIDAGLADAPLEATTPRSGPTAREGAPSTLDESSKDNQPDPNIAALREQRLNLEASREARAQRGEDRSVRAEDRQVAMDKAKAAAEHRQIIAKAFDILGSAFKVPQQHVPTGSSSALGPGQDSGAFKLPPRPQRTPPKVK